MIGDLLALLGVILVFLGVLVLVGVIAIGTAPASTLIVVGIILILVSFFIGTRLYGRGGRTRL